MRRFHRTLLLALTLLVLAQASALAEGDTAAFNTEAFRKNFVSGLAGRNNVPALTPDSVQVDQVERAASLGSLDIYAVKGRLVPAEGQAQPFALFVSADGRFYVADIVELSEGQSLFKGVRERMRTADLKGFGHTILKGAPGKPVLVYVSDPFCPYCREAFSYLLGKQDTYAELRLAHFPLTSHPGADIACALMAWAADKAPGKALDFVRFAYTELAVPKAADRSQENLDKARAQVASAYLARFPELKALGQNGAALVAALADSPYARTVAADMAKAGSMDITGTPVIFVDQARVVGFDQERLDALLK